MDRQSRAPAEALREAAPLLPLPATFVGWAQAVGPDLSTDLSGPRRRMQLAQANHWRACSNHCQPDRCPPNVAATCHLSESAAICRHPSFQPPAWRPGSALQVTGRSGLASWLRHALPLISTINCVSKARPRQQSVRTWAPPTLANACLFAGRYRNQTQTAHRQGPDTGRR